MWLVPTGTQRWCKTTFKISANVDTFHNLVEEQVMALRQTVSIVECVPRLASRQQRHQNTPATSPKKQYKRTITIPLLDHLIGVLSTRFDAESSQVVIKLMQLLPSEVIKTTAQLCPPTLPMLYSFRRMTYPLSTHLTLNWNSAGAGGQVNKSQSSWT